MLYLLTHLSVSVTLFTAPTPPTLDTAKGPERACEVAKPNERFQVDFDQISLRDLTRLVACAAEMNVIFDPPTLGSRTVSVIAAHPVSLMELKKLYRLALARQDLRLERRGAYYMVRETRR